jgi:hypothetical protein
MRFNVVFLRSGSPWSGGRQLRVETKCRLAKHVVAKDKAAK